MLASQRNGTLYVGVTNNLSRRVWQHREGEASGFTAKYGVHRLVWYTHLPTALEAIAFEKKLKRWRREWKLELIEKANPKWLDLYETLNC
jgi:putative endonuclease